MDHKRGQEVSARADECVDDKHDEGPRLRNQGVYGCEKCARAHWGSETPVVLDRWIDARASATTNARLDIT